MKRIFTLRPSYITILSVLTVALAFLYGVPFMDLMELKTIDLRFEARGPVTPRPEIALAVIDEKSIAGEGKWIWPRSKIADLVTRLSDAGARVIGFDIGFLESDEKRTVQTIAEIQGRLSRINLQDASMHNYLESLKLSSDNDRLLAEAIRNSRAKVVLGYFFQMDRESAAHIREEDIARHQSNVKGSSYAYARFTSRGAQNVPLIEALAPQSNIPEISNASELSGYFNMIPDPDGVVRRMAAVLRFREMLYAPLCLVSTSAYLGVPFSVTVGSEGVEELRIGKISIPADEYGQILINYRGKQKTFPHIPATDILRGRVPADRIKDKIVLVGATAVGIYDMRVTPFDSVFPGVEIHANVIDGILSGDFMHHPKWVRIFDLLGILAAGLILGFVLPRTGIAVGAVTASALFAGYIFLCQYVFSRQGLILNMVYPLSAVLLVYVGITAYRYLVESRQKRFIRDAFSTYLAPSVVKQIIDQPEKLVLGGEDRVITAFFSDVQGFTGISEKLTARELVELLNEFLTEMTDIILQNEGTVDKFEGDAIIAFFGAPNDLPNHAEVACRSCLQMQKRLAGLRVKWAAEGKPELKMRIGLCSGPAVVGNMGSKNRMDYTMMGDTVNTASRLEGVNKVYGIYMLIGESTRKAAGDSVIARHIDAINVVGKSEPLEVYELIGFPGEIGETLLETIARYEAGLDLYRSRDWDGAIRHFTAALSLTRDDGPSKTMIERCRLHKDDPPPEGWNGAYTMKSK